MKRPHFLRRHWRGLVRSLAIVLFISLGLNLPVKLSGPTPAAAGDRARTQPLLAALLGLGQTPAAPSGIQGPFVGEVAYAHVFNGDLRDLPSQAPVQRERREFALPIFKGKSELSVYKPDPVKQTEAINAMPTPSLTFPGLNFTANGAGWPPDTNGDVGPNHYIQTVNTSIGIYSKTTGSQLVALDLDTFFTGPLGTPCDNNNAGDPVVVYDTLADRWLVSDFAWTGTDGPYYECIAISQTGNPVSGGWYFYAYLADATILNDYPKFGVWPDAYYMTSNMFPDAGGYAGAWVWAFDRTAMLSGNPLTAIKFMAGDQFGGLLASNMRGALPPAGSPNYIVALAPPDGLSLWKFHVDFATPANSTFTGPIDFPAAFYNLPAGSVPQQGTAQTLDTLGDRLMMQLQYRNLGGVESLWAAHTVDSGATMGVRWYEIRDMATAAPYVRQQGTFQPDALFRWMPSLAVDGQGNMAIGYSVSSSSMFPAIRYAGRLAGDPLGQLSQGEATLFVGTGSQTGISRWGDYSTMTVDPVDECTFWYTTEYYAATGSNWQTRIGAFKFPLCTIAAQGITGTVRDLNTNAILTNVQVQATNAANQSASGFNDSNGVYALQLPAGSYTLTTETYGYLPATLPNIAVSNGLTTTQDILLTAAPTHVVSGTVRDGRTGWPLYAQVTVEGYPGAPVWTDPATGFYSVTLAENTNFTLHAAAWVEGYTNINRNIGLITTNRTEDFDLNADAASCTAPGYVATVATQQDFEATNGGYTLSGTAGSWSWGVPTSGPNAAHSGTKVWATNLAGNYNNNVNGAITSPAIDLSAYAGSSPTVQWWQWLQTEAGYDYAYLEVTSNGSVYTRVYTATGDIDTDAWALRGVTLSPSYATANFHIRFRLTSDGSVTFPGWYVDDVRVIVACDPQPGGLVIGNVYSEASGLPLAGATVAGDQGQTATTQATTDPNTDDSFYTVFSPAGSHPFTATLSGYAPSITTTNVVQSDTVRLDFSLEAPAYGVSLSQAQEYTGTPGSLITYTVTLSNTGNAPDTYTVTVSGQAYTTTVPSPVGPVQANTTTTFAVVVQIPANAVDGNSDIATITVTSQNDPLQTATTTVTTFVSAPAYKLYLPLIRQ